MAAKGARDDPQMKDVFKTLKEIKNQIEQREDPAPPSSKKWKGGYTCYFCGEPGHWRRICSQRTQRRRTAAPMPTRSSEPMDMDGDDSSATEEELKPTPAIGKKSTKKSKLPTKPQYYNPDPVARMFGRANEAHCRSQWGSHYLLGGHRSYCHNSKCRVLCQPRLGSALH